MFIGRIGTQNANTYRTLSLLRQTVIQPHAKQPAVERARVFDQFVRSEQPAEGVGGATDYSAHANKLKRLSPEVITYGEPANHPDLSAELLPPSEREYTAKDALLNQYAKQFRIEGHMEYGEFVVDGQAGLFMGNLVSPEELESFRQELIERGLGDKIDWKGVEEDFVQIGVHFGNAEKLGSKVDYLASRYAVLKGRIEAQYTGDEKENQLEIRNGIYTSAKEEMADAYAGSIGAFFEDLGQAGAAGEMKSSLIAAIDQRASEYEAHLSNAGIYDRVGSQEDSWLCQDDGYMAAQLRESMCKSELDAKHLHAESPYNFQDLKFAGIYAKVLDGQLHQAGGDLAEDDSELGKQLATQYEKLQGIASESGISHKMVQVLQNTFVPYIEKYLDSLDQQIDQNKDSISKNGTLSGMLRTTYINRGMVLEAFYRAAGWKKP